MIVAGDSIRLGASKPGVRGTCHPIGQRVKPILRRGFFRGTEKTWRSRSTIAGIGNVATALHHHDLFAVELVCVQTVGAMILENLVVHLGKDARPAVVVILRPAIEWMVVALGALKSDAQEQLSG